MTSRDILVFFAFLIGVVIAVAITFAGLSGLVGCALYGLARLVGIEFQLTNCLWAGAIFTAASTIGAALKRQGA